MLALAALAVLALQTTTPPDEPLRTLLARVSEEAEVFARRAPKIVGQESLAQRARKAPPRFRPRAGAAALEPPPITYQNREIVSEYGFAAFADDPEALREFRKVIAIDGRRVLDAERARQTLVMNMTSEHDRRRKRMLEDFERHGLIGAATDFGQLLLLFRRRQLGNYVFQIKSQQYVGADPAVVISYRQTGGSNSLRVYHGRRVVQVKLEGELWVRQADRLPLRISVTAANREDNYDVIHAATVDYIMSAHGLLLPASVRYTKHAGNHLVAENVGRYSAYRMFTVSTEIKFTPEEAAPK